MSKLVRALALPRAETADDDQDSATALGEASHEPGECETGKREAGEREVGDDNRWPWRGSGFFGHRRVAR